MTLDDLFTDTDHRNRIQGSSCPLLLIVSANGGAGATTAAITAAELATAVAGINKVLLFDGVIYKGGVSDFLRMNKEAPTIGTAVSQNRTERALIPSDVINTLRNDKVPHVSFDVSLGLNYLSANDMNISNGLRFRMVENARKSANLVIVDCGMPDYRYDGETQFALIAELMKTPNAQMVLMCEPNRPSTLAADHLATLLRQIHNVTRERIMVLTNKVPPYFTRDENWPQLKAGLSAFSHPLDPVGLDVSGIMQPASQGKIPIGQSELTGSLGYAMRRLTGWPEFDPIADAISEEARRAKAVTRAEGSSVIRQQQPEKKSRFGFGSKR